MCVGIHVLILVGWVYFQNRLFAGWELKLVIGSSARTVTRAFSLVLI